MLFNSYVFILFFLPVSLIGFYIAGKKSRELAILWLVISSLFFYGWWNPNLLSIIISSILVNYFISQMFSVYKKRARHILLVIGILLNLATLSYFKYANFFVDNINQFFFTSLYLEKIILPLAISFFTFQQITYLVDTYKNETIEHNFLHYCLFVTFFPQLIAGPIVHHKEMLTQFTKKIFYKIDINNISLGLTIFSIGLFKKVILADGISVYSIAMFNVAEYGLILNTSEYWIGAVAYSLQLYFDFSGYSDMAIGLGLLFGVRLPINFNSPYKSVNIIEFWQRWHITLSRFLKDYLYIPLGGNRYGKIKKYRNLMFTMLLGGLWHGAGWTFIIWGCLHGIYLVINHAWHFIKIQIPFKVNSYSKTLRFFSMFITFLAILVGWVVFRSENIDIASTILLGMLGLIDSNYHELFKISKAVFGIVILLSIVIFMPNTQQFVGYFQENDMKQSQNIQWFAAVAVWKPNLYWGILTGILMSLSILFLARESEFLYFQF